MKQRLDVALVERGLIASREKAKVVIMEGLVYVNGQKSDKAGAQIKDDDKIEIRGETMRYVSRGGKKLEKAMQVFPISLDGCVCIDIGASTGGFTDCMLQNGAVKVYSVDVGYGQLAWSLRNDERVVNLERTNIRYVTDEQIPEPVDFISVDVSFISLTLVLPVAWRLLREGAQMVCLVKPQFEAGKDKVGKKGVVREPSIHREVIEKVAGCAAELGFALRGLDYSPIKGPEGNIEYLLFLQKGGEENVLSEELIAQVVSQAHENL
ncbi:TlyA family RNA methyltransferase [uncultured Negativibacillus sp.]|uniref:TlyA family RNA methyltransferase n=1 Tax=uncultured Negativibacillus sp. TaxID=1980696 RepID=UPI0025DB1216|nr:TlyA family RNA methyltransferase [uncultured Negativibacillus sp.]